MHLSRGIESSGLTKSRHGSDKDVLSDDAKMMSSITSNQTIGVWGTNERVLCDNGVLEELEHSRKRSNHLPREISLFRIAQKSQEARSRLSLSGLGH